ncbi:MAG: glycosyltransferase family 4 protein [Nocardioidaceae bacterium]
MSRSATHRSPSMIFIHPSDELYGADRMLLEFCDALGPVRLRDAEFWLPTDLDHVERPLCEVLERRGATVRHLDLPIIRRAYRKPRALAQLATRMVRLRRELRSVRPRLIYCTTSTTFLCAPIARWGSNATVLGHVQELWSPADARVLGPLSRCCHSMLAISDAVVSPLPGRVRERTTVVANGTPEPDSYEPIGTRSGRLEYLVASRWNSWKGHATLLAAWDKATGPRRLTVLGGPPTSGAGTDVEALRARLADPASVDIVGEVPDIDPYILRTEVMVVPSDKPEPFGLVAIEAFARGRPVVGSDAGGLSSIVTHGVDGWLYPPGDTAALAKILSELTHESVARAGQAARATYEANYTSERFAERWLPLVAGRE